MNAKKLLQQLSEQRGNIITTKAAEADGVSREMLSKLCKAGTIQGITQGQYMLVEDMLKVLLSISLKNEPEGENLKHRSNLAGFYQQSQLEMNKPTKAILYPIIPLVITGIMGYNSFKATGGV